MSEDSMIVLANEGSYGVVATKLAYYKGMLIGFIADDLSEEGKVLHSKMQDFISGLLKNNMTEMEEKLFFSLADSMQLPVFELYQKHIIQGSADFALPKNIFAGTYELKQVIYNPYDPGFTSARKNGKLYISSADSSWPAYKAGIRSNMAIISSTIVNRFSNAWCDCPATLVVLENGKQQTITYMPRGAMQQVWQYVKRDL